MQKHAWRIRLVLVLVIGMTCGCSAQPQAKTPEKTAENREGKSVPKISEKSSGTTATEDPEKTIPTGIPTEADPQSAARHVKQEGSAPLGEKIDPVVQQRIAAMGAKFKEHAAKRLADNAESLDLRQIGIALHTFYDVYKHFPAATGIGNKDSQHQGLSWRIYLLPYLEERALFEQFKLDEAWDSEHNKSLITKMPTVFGKNPDGKTRIHLLTGNGAAFQESIGNTLNQAVDGASFILMAVEGGPETAEIWTKPGGLPFDSQAPLKCLGTIGETFPVLMMDGSFKRLPKSIDPGQFMNLVQPADGTPVDLEKLCRPSIANLPPAKIQAPRTPLKPASSRLSLSYIPKEAFAAVVLHPRRIVGNSVVGNLGTLIPPGMLNGESLKIPDVPNLGPLNLTTLKEGFGVVPENIDEIVVLVDQAVVQNELAGRNLTTPSIGIIVRNSAPLDLDRIAETLNGLPINQEIQEFEGVSIIASPRVNSAIAFINDSTLIMGQASFVRNMISARENVTPTSPLTQRLDTAGNRLAIVAVDAVPVEAAVSQLAKQMPGPLALFTPYVTGAKELSLTIDLDATELIQISLQFKTPLLAGGLFGLLDAQVNEAKKQAPMWRETLMADATSKSFVPYFDQFVTETKLSNETDSITFTIPKMKDLEKLPELLKPAVETMKTTADRTRRANDLGFIGIAMLNYHDSFNRFPALNGPGRKELPHPGLSWRVYLLPYIEQASLYNKFKLDEPWDSQHNKALIAEMPKLYGTNLEGKTSIHVFTGPGAPFQNDVGFRVADITDGMSNTLLAVETGDDTAEIWTKPGGLVFNPQDPLQCLGTIKEFHALMMDGSRRFLKNVKPIEFRKMVQHQDGMPLEVE